MTRYIIRRLLQSFLVVFGVSVLVFVILFQTGDPAILMASPDATKEEVDQLRHDLGFDRPIYVQYLDFASDAARGDFGTSLRQGQPVFKLIRERMPATLKLALTAFVLSVVISIPVGIISATKRNSVWDNLVMGLALLGQSLPAFFLGVMLIFIFAGKLKWLPSYGQGDGSMVTTVKHLVLPAITLATFSLARNARLVRSSLLEVLGLDFVRTARSKGLTESAVTYRHALKNALIPVVTIFGLEFGTLLGGAVITETVFSWPGIGRMIILAIQQRDFPVVVGAVTVIAVIFVFLNLIVDLLYGVIDPRVRYG
ncbi:MAG TPA: ABC transporter permease [Thermomicrobiales bacterium]|nr:ABC transporter permease [Thermomicrobiales bacterium]